MPLQHRIALALFFFICFSFNAASQTWNWAKRNLVIEGMNTFPSQSCIDSRGNTLVLSQKNDRQIISKHDQNGRLIWKRELFLITMQNNTLTKICVDAADNIYLAIAALNRIDNTPFNSPSAHGIIKFNSSGRYLWWRSITHSYSSFIFAPQLIANGNDLFVTLGIRNFESITYNGTLYSNIGNNTRCTWLARLDTSGTVQWFRRIYSPAQPITCNVRDAYPQISVNRQNQLLLTGSATDKLFFETTPAIDYPYNCKHYTYGAVVNGANGVVSWAKELVLDTLPVKANMSILERNTFSSILSNGESVLYRMISRDSSLSTFTSRLDGISSKLYVFDTNGNLKRKDSTGSIENGWHEMYQLTGGDATNFYSAGVKQSPYGGMFLFEAAKWDTTLKAVWKKNTESVSSQPTFTSRQLFYRKNRLSLMLQSGSGSNNGFHFYFGADSLQPYLENMYASMLDSVSIIAGTAFFDQNQNGTRQNGEPPAPGLLITDATGTVIYGVTDARGYYEIAVAPGNYTLKLLNLAAAYPHHTIVQPLQHSITLSQTGIYERNRNFALRPSASILDGQINISPYTIARPGGNFSNRVYITNPGTQAFVPNYKLTYDTSKLTYFSSIQSPSSIAPTQLSYINAGIAPGDTIRNDVTFKIKTSAVAGDTIRIFAELNTSLPDGLMINNKDSAVRIVVSSFDPNDKQVYPFKYANYDSVLAAKQELDYTIRFQNTGNDTAFTVLIADTLDSKLDYASFRLIAASHPVNVLWNKSGFAGFQFNNILLPDSTTNRDASNGFVRFKIKPKINVLLSDIVQNKASIYFDYNAPIVTNTVTTSFINTITTGVQNVTVNSNLLDVWPVPFQNFLYLKMKNNFPGEAVLTEIYDAAGRIIFYRREPVSRSAVTSLNLSGLSTGTYYLVVTTANARRFVQQIIKQ